MRLVTLLTALSLFACGAGDESAASAASNAAGGGAGASGSAGSAGAGGGPDRPAPTPSEVLSVDKYDCSAKGPFVPAARPHTATCLFEATCSSRFVTAHRMSNPFAPENSSSALRAAIRLGVDIAETDVRLTADGHVVLIHDAEVDRTLSGTGDVEKMTLAELQALAVNLEPSDPKGDFGCERVMTLEAAMAIAKGKIVVELETKRTDAGIAAAKYLKEQGLYDSAYVQCDATECKAIRAVVPDVPMSLRALEPADLDLLDELHPIIVEVDPGETWLNPTVRAKINGKGAKVFTNAFVVADVKALGSDDLSGYVAMYESGVDILQTEFPHWALWSLGRLPLPASP